MKKSSKIYVAGHKGLVGSSLVKLLSKRGYKNLIVKEKEKLDLRGQSATERFFSKLKPDYVFLSAAKVGGILANSTYKAEFLYDNLTIAANIINSSYKYKVKKLLNLGSSCIYPRLCHQPMKEEYLLSGKLEATNEPYAIAKIAAIKLCRYYNEQYATNYISVMPTNLYGADDNFNLETSHVIPAILRKLFLSKLLEHNDFISLRNNLKRWPLGFGLDKKIRVSDEKSIISSLAKLGIKNNEVVLWGSGEPIREFMFADDLAAAAIFLMEKYDYKDIGEFINVGTGEGVRIKDIVKIMREIIDYRGLISWDRSKPDGTPQKVLDISKITSLGWKAEVGIREGIKIVYQKLRNE